MSVFGPEVDKAADAMTKATIKAKEFEGKGLKLQFKSVERIRGQYGAAEDSSIVEKGILEEGEQFLYKFVDEEGMERKHYSTSMPFFIGMKQIEFNEGDWLFIKREGKTAKDTRYTAEVISGVEVKKPKPEITKDEVPF
jgi:hypothetical protein